MTRAAARVCLLLVSAVAAPVLAEACYRLWGPDPESPPEHGLQLEDAAGVRVLDRDPTAPPLVEPVEHSPRPRLNFVPNAVVYLCYTGGRQPYFDERGRVEMRFNSCAIRERDELCAPKPAGQQRIVCLGDSMTVGWGVRVEDAWPRLVEDILRRDGRDQVRTVNCGAAGTMMVDEYWWGLRHRFFEFEPDLVLVTLCMNDLLALNGGMSQFREGSLQDVARTPWWHSRMLRDLLRGPAMGSWLRIDPDHDVVQELLDLPEDHERYRAVSRSAYWAGGGPQLALRASRAWCHQRGIGFGVVMWPLFQGLGEDEHYPFTRMHELVAEFCAEYQIPFLDLLPVFRGHNTVALWVNPGDLHGNHIAHRLASDEIAAFAGPLLPPAEGR